VSVVRVSGHGGVHALAVAREYGVPTMFTLSGGHVFPLYDAAVKGGQPMRLVDVRHEQTAVFAAEATARLTRTPGLAVVTAGPGVTNSVSGVTTAWPRSPSGPGRSTTRRTWPGRSMRRSAWR
jgi:acetolactate synthase I/II/III large subunit